jgi:putative transposase
MHLTLKKEATRPAAKNFLQQQAKFDSLPRVLQSRAPHQALGMRCPASSTSLSAPLPRLERPRLPFHDRSITVTRCGRICFGGRKIN